MVPGELTDPMSGFFMMRRSMLDGSVRKLSAIGFKILTDLFASHRPPLRFSELAYTFRAHHAVASKLDSVTVWDYVMLLLDKMVGRWMPVRFLGFSIVGAAGVAVHFAVLTLILQGLQRSFATGQALATFCAMTFNYTVNNVLTYRDLRLHGVHWLRGWAFAAIAGILVGAVWNYAVTMMTTWGRPSK